MRECKIIDADIAAADDGDGDAAYDLVDLEGTREVVGAAITEQLRYCDLSNTTNNEPLILTIKVKITR